MSGQIYLANRARRSSGESGLIRATISDLEDSSSAYLRRVKAGEPILVLERRTPVARIVPLGRGAEEDPSSIGFVCFDARLNKAASQEGFRVLA